MILSMYLRNECDVKTLGEKLEKLPINRICIKLESILSYDIKYYICNGIVYREFITGNDIYIDKIE
jgi:hypothetical protein